MRYLVFIIVLAISAGSVVFGVEWMQAPMTPMPASPYQLRAANPPAPAPVQQAAKPVEPAKAVAPAAPAALPAPPVAAAPLMPPASTVAAAPADPASIVAPEPQPQIAASPAPPPLCDVSACERAYRTFTASDCTYQPSGDGPRRLCTRGNPPAAANSSRPDIRAQATCNIAACSQAYISFNASDCTYQPSEGPRRICER